LVAVAGAGAAAGAAAAIAAEGETNEMDRLWLFESSSENTLMLLSSSVIGDCNCT
jgi:hypothetical protein